MTRTNLFQQTLYLCIVVISFSAANAKAETRLDKKLFVLPKSTKTSLLILGPESLDATGSYRLTVPLEGLVPGKKSFARIRLRNDSHEAIQIHDVSLSCNCTEFGFRSENGGKIPAIPVGDELEAIVGINVPQTQTTRFRQSARLSIGDSEPRFISISFRGEIEVPFKVRSIEAENITESDGWKSIAQIVPNKRFRALKFNVDCGEHGLNPRIVVAAGGSALQVPSTHTASGQVLFRIQAKLPVDSKTSQELVWERHLWFELQAGKAKRSWLVAPKRLSISSFSQGSLELRLIRLSDEVPESGSFFLRGENFRLKPVETDRSSFLTTVRFDAAALRGVTDKVLVFEIIDDKRVVFSQDLSLLP